jgi:hypothetical protein
MPNTDPNTGKQLPLRQRLIWFFGIWAASAVVVAAFAYGLRAIFRL